MTFFPINDSNWSPEQIQDFFYLRVNITDFLILILFIIIIIIIIIIIRLIILID